MSIKAVTFDYGGVIVGTPSSDFNARICAIIGISEDKFLEEYFKINHRLNKEGITLKQLFTDLLIILGKEDRQDEVMAALENSFLKDKTINEPVLNLIKKLKSSGYKTAILSNNTVENAKNMRTQLSDYFDAILVSMEIGAQKPEPAAFEQLFTALGVSPEETVFIDDSTKSLSTAIEIGYHPILFRSFEDLHSQLIKLGVTID